jgi:hypothetical protein
MNRSSNNYSETYKLYSTTQGLEIMVCVSAVDMLLLSGHLGCFAGATWSPYAKFLLL